MQTLSCLYRRLLKMIAPGGNHEPQSAEYTLGFIAHCWNRENIERHLSQMRVFITANSSPPFKRKPKVNWLLVAISLKLIPDGYFLDFTSCLSLGFLRDCEMFPTCPVRASLPFLPVISYLRRVVAYRWNSIAI